METKVQNGKWELCLLFKLPVSAIFLAYFIIWAVSFHKFNMPQAETVLPVTIISLIGIITGLKSQQEKEKTIITYKIIPEPALKTLA